MRRRTVVVVIDIIVVVFVDVVVVPVGVNQSVAPLSAVGSVVVDGVAVLVGSVGNVSVVCRAQSRSSVVIARTVLRNFSVDVSLNSDALLLSSGKKYQNIFFFYFAQNSFFLLCTLFRKDKNVVLQQKLHRLVRRTLN
jgi:hypothetical protein